MLGDALFPVFTIAVLCVIAGFAASNEMRGSGMASVWTGIVAFFAAFIALAPVPPFLFARHYARMAARARGLLDLGPREPWLEPIGVSLWKTIAQAIINMAVKGYIQIEEGDGHEYTLTRTVVGDRELSDEERALYEQLGQARHSDPRAEILAASRRSSS